MVQQYLPGLILNSILEIVGEMGDPYHPRPELGGMTAYPPRAMAVVCILMEAEMETYRKMSAISGCVRTLYAGSDCPEYRPRAPSGAPMG
jgi:hypothetical protein